MIEIVCVIIGAVIGFIIGVLVFNNNKVLLQEKIAELEALKNLAEIKLSEYRSREVSQKVTKE